MENTTSILIALLQDIHPDTVVFRSSNIYTAADMIHELEMNTNTGKQWGSDFLRVCRDMLARKSRNNLRG